MSFQAQKRAASAIALIFSLSLMLPIAWLNHAFLSASLALTRGLYPVEGVGLGDVITSKELYRSLHCSPSDVFKSSTWCQRSQKDKGKQAEFTNTIAFSHNDKGEVVYLARVIEPAFFGPDDINEEITRLSILHQQQAKILRMPQKAGLPRGVIASWGGVTLDLLDPASVQLLADGKSPKKGFLVDFLNNFKLIFDS